MTTDNKPLPRLKLSGPDHYREAERLIALFREENVAMVHGGFWNITPVTLTEAQVHATLALAAATALPAVRQYWGDEDTTSGRAWSEVT